MDEQQGEYLYIIGVGSSEDWDAGRGSIYYIEDKNGEKALPVFTTPEKLQHHLEVNFVAPEAHMDMMESVPESHIEPLTGGRFLIMPYKFEHVAEWAVRIGADYIVRDPRPGPEQEIMRVPK